MDAKASPGPGEPETKDQLRFITCGSVDDGKSTLIGRLLHDSKMIYEDQLKALQRDSAKHGTTGDDIDFALLVDGLEAEREQGITIDVAYRFFNTPRRSFMVADTPGHEQYTRNMATGASNAQLAIILIDARKGVLVQTRRHSFICSLLGIRHVVLAVNKIDLVGYDKDIFDRIVADYAAFASGLGFASIVPIPISARFGDNIINRSSLTCWYQGPCLLDYLERIDIRSEKARQPFRFPVQWVNRPNPDFRGYAGTVASGRIAEGDEIVVAASGRTTRIKRIVTSDGDLAAAEAEDAVTLTLEDEIDVGRGDVLAQADRAAGSRRSVRGASDLDGRGPDGSGPQLYLPDRDAVGLRQHHHDQAPHRRQHPQPPRGHHAQPQRNRLLQCGGGLPGGLRSL